ncbi:hypothetical protein ASNO1_35910 [Corallococcus caeni]|uniref:Uncharacterized protein n=1 Tax=Corallococcus caeni TaxID=3082388 RepID=A0ABQ6QTJ8_9BACT|nr:hypothetical protein ASNO1_35910 [Corallococcus sp. NO1]
MRMSHLASREPRGPWKGAEMFWKEARFCFRPLALVQGGRRAGPPGFTALRTVLYNRPSPRRRNPNACA